MPQEWKNASVDYYDSRAIIQEELEFIVDARQVFALREKEVHADGSVTYRSSARNDYASLKVPGVPVPIKARTLTLRKVLKKDLPVDYLALPGERKSGRISIAVGATRLSRVTRCSRTVSLASVSMRDSLMLSCAPCRIHVPRSDRLCSAIL